MNLIETFRKVVEELKARDISFALAGGMVASFYRKQARATDDLDFVVYSEKNFELNASDIFKFFELTMHFLRKAELEGGPMFAIKKKSSPIWIISGRASDNNRTGIDFILSEVLWVKEAILRSKKNEIDFGFGKVPCITVEDLILSKIYSLKNQSTRFMDIDDLRSIFEAYESAQIDIVYLTSRMASLKLSFPKELIAFIPKELQRTYKKIK